MMLQIGDDAEPREPRDHTDRDDVESGFDET
jgi:hypothetical protein